MRADYLYLQDNPLFEKISEKLKKNTINDPHQFIACNILALSYGLHFYNHISNFSLYKPGEDPDIEFIFRKDFPTVFVTLFSDTTYINFSTSNFDLEFNHDPVKSFPFIDDPEVEFPCYISQILAGIEEASHLHLQKLQLEHGANINSAIDHPSHDLWKTAPLVKYRSVLWHEFAAATVQHSYITKYLYEDFPISSAEFEKFYQKVKKERKKWLKSKKHWLLRPFVILSNG